MTATVDEKLSTIQETPRSPSKNRRRGGFRTKRYDNVEHVWNRKPFAKDKVRFLFGGMNEAKMDRVVSKKRQQIAKQPGLLDCEGLVLNDMCSPFKSNLLISVNQEAQKIPSNIKVEYLSGTWLSKVYRGNYDRFLDWIDDAEAYVKEKYGKQVDPHHNWYVYYPSALEHQKSPIEDVLVFFIKVSED